MSIKNKILLSYTIAFLGVVFIIVLPNLSLTKKEMVGCGTITPVCGNVLNENQREGKKLFKSLCASCHKINKQLVGPALGNIKMDSITLYKYLSKMDTMNYHTPQFKQLSIQNIEKLLGYIKD
ncbi:Cytochrome c domain-containing protein [Tenacibaculum sp. 190524A02b]|uniref:Cytochrome c domain-containing protein n=1 Tax=Tenacibaculum vairaonense TaxID=3137860 RepID=A0ABP1FHT0_9FLAO